MKVLLSRYIIGFIATFCVTQSAGISEHVREYCLRSNSESFKAQCFKNEVIIITHARYGRMRIGSCLESEGKDILEAFGNDRRFLGCSVDVLALLDRKCSGRNHCEIKGNEDDLQMMSPCHTALKSYLEASYDCATVVDGDRSCEIRASPTTQYIQPIINSSSSQIRCGTAQQPWKLLASSGQQINVNLLEFGEAKHHTPCKQRGYVVDKLTKKNTTLCSEFSERITAAVTSHAHELDLVLLDSQQRSSEEGPLFLIQFTAIGCMNVIPPWDAWLRRNGNTAVVGCYTSRQTWTLRCVKNQWIGVIGNCSLEIEKRDLEQASELVSSENSTSMEVIVIVAISMVALFICLIIIVTGAVCWKRYYAKYKMYSLRQKYYKHTNSTDKIYIETTQPIAESA